MTLSDLLTPKGRRATVKLSLDLLKITGKVAVAGTAGLVGALASAAASTQSVNKTEDQRLGSNSEPDGYDNGPDGFGYYSGGIRVDNDND